MIIIKKVTLVLGILVVGLLVVNQSPLSSSVDYDLSFDHDLGIIDGDSPFLGPGTGGDLPPLNPAPPPPGPCDPDSGFCITP